MPGKVFILASILLASLTACSTKPAGAVFDLEKLTTQRVVDRGGSGVIHLRTDRGGAALFVPVKIGGREGWLQVDTGAAVTVLTADVCDANGYQPFAKGHASTPTGDSTPVSVGYIDSITIDQVEIQIPVVARVESKSYFRGLAKPSGRGPVFGLLGLDTLKLIGAEIDVRNNVIRLRRRPVAPHQARKS